MPKIDTQVTPKIINARELLFNNKLFIPPYQRPYKWTSKNVNQLIDDIILHTDKSAYRIGTVVTHKEKDNIQHNIVDGQQRIYTLSMIAYELLSQEKIGKHFDRKKQDLALIGLQLSNTITIQNLKLNHQLIKSRIREFDIDTALYFFNKCEFVYIELSDISEAFQFFDSQNSRGKDLAPHDLLKAFHLRIMMQNTENDRLECVKNWEGVAENLHYVFQNYLYKVRCWSKGKSGMYFTKDNIDVFKGITIEEAENYNFIKNYRINHFFTEQYNNDLVRKIDLNKQEYPFQVDQVMINGKRFFEYIHYYSKKIHQIQGLFGGKDNRLRNEIEVMLQNNSIAKKIIHVLRTYKGRNRSGDLYLRNLFDCCLFYYLDKFGNYQIEKAIENFFIWSFTLRLEKKAVKRVSADNLAMKENGYFRLIREAVHIKEVVHIRRAPFSYDSKNPPVQHLEEIVDLFKNLNVIFNEQ